jgi:hypothetical protein
MEPEQKRMTWKPRDYNPETDPYKDVPLQKMMMQIPHMIQENTPFHTMKLRQKE